jgi:hypothetical protein
MCSCLIILNQNDKVCLVGRNTTKDQWIEIYCNREDEHPLSGSTHTHITEDGFTISWDVPEDAVWMG